MYWYDDAYSEMDRVRSEMNRLLGGIGQAGNRAATFPLVNVYDGKDDLIVTAELPGLSKDRVSITFSDGLLTLSGTIEPLDRVKTMAVLRKERSEGEFEKTLRIPAKIKQDDIKASFVNGILTVTLPKAEEAKPRTIAVEAK